MLNKSPQVKLFAWFIEKCAGHDWLRRCASNVEKAGRTLDVRHKLLDLNPLQHRDFAPR
jgi:hypothetical protein